MFYKNILVIGFSTALVACGGGSSGDDSDDDVIGSKSVSGTLVVPESFSATSARAFNSRNPLFAAMTVCANVPTGYLPLENASVDFVDASGASVDSATTDECGLFSANVPEEVVQARSFTANNRDIVADIDVFESSVGNVVSTIPAAASYQIASIQSVSSNEVAFAVTDTVTNKAVIGIPDSAFDISINSQPTTFNEIQSSAATADTATVTLVLDASGSMSASAEDNNGNSILDSDGFEFSRNRLTALASHTFLDNVANGDETGVVIFGSDVDFVDDALLANIDLVDGAGNDVAPYTFSSDGYTSNPADLRFVIDAYNDDSKLYSFGLDDIHPDTPDVLISGFVPWGGSTALYDAISEGLDRTSARLNSRKVIIAMSDGSNNSSVNSIEDVIAEANTANIPVYTVAYEGGNPEAMEDIALGTNATTFVVNGTDLSGAFQSIQTGITFQYIADFIGSTQVGDVVTIKLNLNGTTVERDLSL